MELTGKIDLSLTIDGVTFRNPVIAASGTFGYGSEYAPLFEVSALGGICTKGITLHPKAGNRGIRLCETPSGILNSIGLENPGVEAFINTQLPRLRALGPVVIANLGGDNLDEYCLGAQLLDASSVDMIELNISCPNVKAGGMAFGLDPDCAAGVVRAVRQASSKPLIVKLSPNAPSILDVALACEENGASALSLTNTFKAMVIDIHRRAPVFDNFSAGFSGPAIRPIALQMVWDVCAAVSVPVIGIGGIDSAGAALQYFLAGACAVEVGTATFAHPGTMLEIIQGIEDYMCSYGMTSLSQLSIRSYQH